ncbi:MAG: hypothetical protein IPI67_21235 [Myxococcales bacterium]|nr:hypothetical protein [Myxococcales bacterium]
MRKRAWISLALTAGAGLLALRFGPSSAEAQPARGPGQGMLQGLARPAIALTGPAVSELEAARHRDQLAHARATRLAEQLRNMPDLTQTDPALGVSGGGEAWCGPVAMSNALMWLAENGRETLVPTGESERARHLELVRKLGSGRYMGTTPNGGTGVKNVLQGLHAFMRDSGWGYKRLAYQGWRGHPVRFTTGVKSAELGFIEQALAQGGIAVIHAGWYTPAKYGGDFYRRHGGHWLTVVGSNIDENAEPTPDTLVVHDPAPYAGAEGARHFVKLTRLESGWLMAEDGAFPAKGFTRLEGGMKIKKDGDLAVLDGAIVLVP